MKGLSYEFKAQRQPPKELWRKLPYVVDKTPSWVESTQVPQWVLKKKKKIFP